MRNRVGFLALIAAVIVTLASTSHADVIFSTITSNCKCGLGGPASGTDLVAVPFSFTSSSSYRLTDAAVRLTNFGTSTPLNFFIYSDSSGLPGAQLASLTGTVPATPVEGTEWEGVITSGAPNPALTLTSGAQYWLVLGLTHTLGWDGAGSQPFYPTFYTGSGWETGSFPTNLQFKIEGAEILPTEQVPEPSCLLLLGSGVLGLCSLGSIRRRFRA